MKNGTQWCYPVVLPIPMAKSKYNPSKEGVRIVVELSNSIDYEDYGQKSGDYRGMPCTRYTSLKPQRIIGVFSECYAVA